MSNKHSSAALGLLVLVGAVVLLFVPRRVLSKVPAALLTAVAIAGILLVLLVAVVLFFAFRKPKAESREAVDGEAVKVLAKGRSDLLALRQLIMRLKNQKIRSLGGEICAASDKIIQALRDQPKDVFRARQFFNYYLPTLGVILRKYRVLEDSGVRADDTTENVISCLGLIKEAMEKQYENLFDDDKLDLTVEIEVLKQMCRRDGLLTDDDFKSQGGEEGITLRGNHG